MSYYQGDFYQGDPGFLSGLGRLAGFAGSFLPGVGGIVGKVSTALTRSKPAQIIGRAVMQHPTLSAAGGAGIIGGGMGVMAQRMRTGPMMAAPGGMAMRGYHMSKPRKCLGQIIPSHPVRNRRMRVTNPKALRRAIRRAHGFARLARKVMSFTSPRGVRGRAHFRVRRRAKR